MFNTFIISFASFIVKVSPALLSLRYKELLFIPIFSATNSIDNPFSTIFAFNLLTFTSTVTCLFLLNFIMSHLVRLTTYYDIVFLMSRQKSHKNIILSCIHGY